MAADIAILANTGGIDYPGIAVNPKNQSPEDNMKPRRNKCYISTITRNSGLSAGLLAL
jgi:hypothetical protein